MSYAVESSNGERSGKQCPTASSSLQDVLGSGTCHHEENRLKSIIGKTSSTHPDDSLMILLLLLLLLLPRLVIECTPERTLEPAIPDNTVALDEKENSEKTPGPKKGAPNHGATQKMAFLCLVQVSDASKRKSSIISEHQKYAGPRGDSACIKEIQEPTSDSEDQNEIISSITSKPAPGTSYERKKETHANTASSDPILHSDARGQDVATTPISANNANNYQLPETSGPNQVLSRALSERKVETLS